MRVVLAVARILIGAVVVLGMAGAVVYGALIRSDGLTIMDAGIAFGAVGAAVILFLFVGVLDRGKKKPKVVETRIAIAPRPALPARQPSAPLATRGGVGVRIAGGSEAKPMIAALEARMETRRPAMILPHPGDTLPTPVPSAAVVAETTTIQAGATIQTETSVPEGGKGAVSVNVSVGVNIGLGVGVVPQVATAQAPVLDWVFPDGEAAATEMPAPTVITLAPPDDPRLNVFFELPAMPSDSVVVVSEAAEPEAIEAEVVEAEVIDAADRVQDLRVAALALVSGIAEEPAPEPAARVGAEPEPVVVAEAVAPSMPDELAVLVRALDALRDTEAPETLPVGEPTRRSATRRRRIFHRTLPRPGLTVIEGGRQLPA